MGLSLQGSSEESKRLAKPSCHGTQSQRDLRQPHSFPRLRRGRSSFLSSSRSDTSFRLSSVDQRTMANDQQRLLYLFELPQEPIQTPRGGGSVQFKLENDDTPPSVATRVGLSPSVSVPVPERKDVALQDLGTATSIPMGSAFSFFLASHRRAARDLCNVFMKTNGAEDLMQVAARVHGKVNETLFIYAISFVILRKKELHSVRLPTMVEVFPSRFVPQRALSRAQLQVNRMDPNQSEAVIIEHGPEFSGSPVKPEHRVSYWREDYGINVHHWHWHLIYPPGMGVDRDRKGELFYYMHQQIIASSPSEGFFKASATGAVPFSEDGLLPQKTGLSTTPQGLGLVSRPRTHAAPEDQKIRVPSDNFTKMTDVAQTIKITPPICSPCPFLFIPLYTPPPHHNVPPPFTIIDPHPSLPSPPLSHPYPSSPPLLLPHPSFPLPPPSHPPSLPSLPPLTRPPISSAAFLIQSPLLPLSAGHPQHPHPPPTLHFPLFDSPPSPPRPPPRSLSPIHPHYLPLPICPSPPRHLPPRPLPSPIHSPRRPFSPPPPTSPLPPLPPFTLFSRPPPLPLLLILHSHLLALFPSSPPFSPPSHFSNHMIPIPPLTSRLPSYSHCPPFRPLTPTVFL
ncbi:prophenoloxidase [Penaeus vannamei]|uniref:Prophenoloxidase n=1 Tax=Penaeus vannamei TaxID=6689 RepID=A0A423SAM7_PENVA|nr:prophenoloxidase [Penaeus vannamei]